MEGGLPGIFGITIKQVARLTMQRSREASRKRALLRPSKFTKKYLQRDICEIKLGE
jgi:hypothetical protein